MNDKLANFNEWNIYNQWIIIDFPTKDAICKVYTDVSNCIANVYNSLLNIYSDSNYYLYQILFFNKRNKSIKPISYLHSKLKFDKKKNNKKYILNNKSNCNKKVNGIFVNW